MEIMSSSPDSVPNRRASSPQNYPQSSTLIHQINPQAIRAKLADPNFNSSQFLEPYLRGLFGSPDLENHILSVLQELSEKILQLNLFLERESFDLEYSAENTDKKLTQKLESHNAKLVELKKKMFKISENFGKISDGAIRISDRLNTAERQRQRIERAIELMNYIKELEANGTSPYENIMQNKSVDELKEYLPVGLRDLNWGDISKVMNSSRK
jgi:hypothetical protein